MRKKKLNSLHLEANLLNFKWYFSLVEDESKKKIKQQMELLNLADICGLLQSNKLFEKQKLFLNSLFF